MNATLARLLAWAGKNERHLGAIVFVGGFVIDVLTFGELPLYLVSYLFMFYLGAVLISTTATHYLHSHASVNTTVTRVATILFPLVAQFCIGSLLSGTLIFYTRSGSVFVSWPFLSILLLAFIGSEYLRMYKDRLVFQAILLYVAFYTYMIFAVPFYLHRIDSSTFYIATGLSVLFGLVFFFALYLIGRTRFVSSFAYIMLGLVLSTVIMVCSYALRILPPLPLTLKDIGMYHSVSHSSDGYVLYGEPTPWHTRYTGDTVHFTSGETIYAYSAVFAPTTFTADLTHVWERYDEVTRTWTPMTAISFPISGGRDGGYRGYSGTTRLTAGKWRVSVETESNQVIGRIHFIAVESSTTPDLVKTIK